MPEQVGKFVNGAATFGIMTLSIKPLIIVILSTTILSISAFSMQQSA